MRARIDSGLTGVSADRQLKYAEWLRDTVKECSASMRRSIALAILLVTVFELIASLGAVDLALGPLKIPKPSALLVFVPTGVSYLLLQTFVQESKLNEASIAFQMTLRYWGSNVSRSGLAELISPPQPLYYINAAEPEAGSYFNAGDRAGMLVRQILAGAFYLALFAFYAHAYVVLFTTLGPANVWLWLTLSLTVVFTAGACFFGFQWINAHYGWP